MTTRVTFEAATIGDAMKRAARVAPAKVGTSFDKAAGIVLDIAPGTDAPCIVRATDTEVFYLEVLETISAEGDKCRWRLPSQLMASVIGAIPPTSGRTVTFTWQGSGPITITSSRMKIELNLILNPFYPDWDAIDASSLVSAPAFGAAITRVEWAASKEGPPPLNGVLIDGTYMVATDRYRIARVECSVPMSGGPIIIPAWSIGSLLKSMGDVLIGTSGNMFVAMPDDFTQIQVVTLGEKFAPVQKAYELPYEEHVTVGREELIRYINSAVQFAGANRDPMVTLWFGREELAVHLHNQDLGMFGDVILTPGQATHERMKIHFTPKMLLDALNQAPNARVTLNYKPGDIKKPIRIDGDSGYTVWCVPRTEISNS